MVEGRAPRLLEAVAAGKLILHWLGGFLDQSQLLLTVVGFALVVRGLPGLAGRAYRALDRYIRKALFCHLTPWRAPLGGDKSLDKDGGRVESCLWGWSGRTT